MTRGGGGGGGGGVEHTAALSGSELSTLPESDRTKLQQLFFTEESQFS